MGRGIASRALAGGHTVRIIDRTAQKADQLAVDLTAENPGGDIESGGDADIGGADLVVLALKYPITMQVADQYGAVLDGKPVVDIANPADFTTFDPITAPGSSAAEDLAAHLPAVRVVKAFNTTFAATLSTGEVDGRPLDVFLAGDHADAKATVTELVTSAGLHAIDVGPLRRARALEAFQIMHMSLQQDMPNPWHSAITLLT
jgi:predicted dinucleotide-binding enzyme